MLKKHYLLSPGPTPIPEDVLASACTPLMHHRTPEFSDILMDVTKGLQYVFQTSNPIFILSSSGTGAMEAAVVNLLSPDDEVMTINGGKFGDRWGQICRSYGINVKEIALPWGSSLKKERLAEELKAAPQTKAVFSTLCETSSGTLFDIKGFSEIVSSTDAILVVDGISGIGATPCPMDEWKTDVLLAASQKSFMTPPGLAYLSLSQKAWSLVQKSSLPKYYFDIQKAQKSLKNKTTPFTPCISLIIQQKKALDIINSLGLEKLFEHHRILGEATRAGVQAIGLKLLSKAPGNALTAVQVPEGMDGIKLIKTMQQKYRAFIAGAQEPYKGQFFRIGHLGYISGFDIITALTALEMTLSDLGYGFNNGDAVKAAKIILKENWQ